MEWDFKPSFGAQFSAPPPKAPLLKQCKGALLIPAPTSWPGRG